MWQMTLGNSTKLGGKVSNHLGKMGVIGSLASGVSTYLERKDKYGDEVALQDATVHTGITATSTIVGSMIGSAIPIPVVGTLFGAWVGSTLEICYQQPMMNLDTKTGII